MRGGQPTLILHAGMPRTGTTSLQRALAASADLLARAGAEYPSRWWAQQAPAHHPLATEVQERGASGPLAGELLTHLGAGPGVTIISSETLTNGLAGERFDALRDFLATASQGAEVRFLLAVRRSDELVSSMYLRQLELDDPGPAGDYAWHRLPWIDDVFANLAELRESPRLPTPELVPYIQGREATAPLLERMGLDAAAPPTERLARSPGLKAAAVLASMDELEIGLDRQALAHALRSEGITLPGERRDFHVLGPTLREYLHLHALGSAARHGHREYVEAFGEAELDQAPRARLDASQLDPEDLAALEEYLAAAAAR